jgi:uncharacterized protein YndB with AHSA1/START domain
MVAGTASEKAAMNQTTMEVRSDRELVITRTFNGPAQLVFEAFTRPEHVRRWWAPKSRNVSVVLCEADVRVGGRYRYVLRKNTGGDDIAFSGVYTEVTPPSRLVFTCVFEPLADAGAVVQTVTFTERDGRTEMVSHEVYPSKEARDAALATGMEHGMREAMDQLDDLIVSLQ